MSDQILRERFTEALVELLEETFERSHGIFLDRNTSLFETLATVTAEEASIPVGGRCATLAAQVEHVRFYLDMLIEFIEGRNPGKIDWGEIWRTVSSVTPDEWEASKNRLRESHGRVVTLAKGYGAWENPNAMAGAIGLVAHSAYHLGEIRQALCTVKRQG